MGITSESRTFSFTFEGGSTSAARRSSLTVRVGLGRQNGGELVLGPGNASSPYVHIMKHSTDHTEIEE